MIRALALLAALSLALASPVQAKKTPAPDTSFTATMKALAGAGDVIAANKIEVRVFNDEKALLAVRALGAVIGDDSTPKPTITHVIVLVDERQTLILVFEGEKMLTSIADKPALGKAMLTQFDRLSA